MGYEDDGTVHTGQTYYFREDDLYGIQRIGTPCQLPSGRYRATHTMTGVKIRPLEESDGRDELISLPAGIIESVMTMFTAFWKKRSQFKSLGFAHKRGVMLEGPPGCGKTVVTEAITQRAVDMGGVAVMQTTDVDMLYAIMTQIRAVEPDRPVLVVLEDLEQMVLDDEEALLDLLDGSRSFDGVFFLFTTNNVGTIPKRIVGRPGRIDRVIHVGPPETTQRVAFLQNRMSCSLDEANLFADVTGGLSFADLREFVISVRLFDNDPAATAAMLRENSATDDHAARASTANEEVNG